MKCLCCITAILILASMPVTVSAINESISLGYGFAALCPHSGLGKTQSGPYDFLQVAFATEKALTAKRLNLLFEPFVAYINRPTDGLDAGFSLALRVYTGEEQYRGLFFTLGTGAAYTSVDFVEQGTHLMFMLEGGVGYRWKNFFIEDRFRHYSNGGLASPNRSVNANIVKVGIYF